MGGKPSSQSHVDKHQPIQVQQPDAAGQHAAAEKRASSKPPAIVSAVSGAMSGALISACVQPLDVVRTRMQADAANGIRRTTAEALKVVLSESGVRGLWRGTGPTVVRLSFGAGINFVALENMKEFMLQGVAANGQLGNLQAAAVGGFSRAFAAAIMSPVTLIKTRMEYSGPNHARYTSTFNAAQMIVKQEGPRALWRGLGPTVLTNAPFSALYYMFYQQLKKALAEEGRPQVVVNFTSGVAAATAATLLTQPTDVVRARMQLGGVAAGGTRASMLATIGHVLRTQGPSALLTGAGPRVLKRTLQTALVWTLYEELLPQLTTVWVGVQGALASQQNKPVQAAAADSRTK